MSTLPAVALHTALRHAFLLLPGRITARALVHVTHRAHTAARATTQHWVKTERYTKRWIENAAAPPPPPRPFNFHNLKMHAPPASFVQIFREGVATGSPPGSLQALEAVVRAAIENGQCGKPLGAGYGFSNVAATDGYLTQLPGLDAILPIDPSLVNAGGKTLLQFEAGATIDRLNDAMPPGFALINQPGYELLTFAGVASAGGHGSSLRWGALADAIRSMRILCVDDSRKPKWFQIEPTGGITIAGAFEKRHPDVTLIQDDATFDACVVSMGCMGIVYSMIIELRPVKTLTETRAFMSWSDAKRRFPDLVAENKDPKSDLHSFVYWLNPYATLGGEQHVVVATYYERGDPLDGKRPIEVTELGGNLAVEELVVAIVNWLPALAPLLIDAAIEGATDRDVVMNAPQALNFGAPNNLNVLATACGVPLDEALATAHRLSKMLHPRKHKLTSTFGMRFVPKGRGLFSPQGAGDTCMIEVPCLAGTHGIEHTLEACWKDMVDHGARPHWGQRNHLDAKQLREVYGEATVDAFCAVRKRLDPTGFFDNAFTRQVGL